MILNWKLKEYRGYRGRERRGARPYGPEGGPAISLHGPGYDARPFLSRGHSTLLLVVSVRLSVHPSVRWSVTFLKFSLFLSVMDYCEVCKCEILLYCWSTVVLHLSNRPRLLPWFGLVFLFRQSMKKRHVSGIAEPSIKIMTTLCVFHWFIVMHLTMGSKHYDPFE